MNSRILLLRLWHSFITGGLATLILVSASCGSRSTDGGSSAGGGAPAPPDTPVLTTISPNGATAGTLAVGLTLNGSNFASNATVQWNGVSIPSSWISSSLMTAAIPTSAVASVGSVKVTVTNPSPGGATSASLTFTIVAAPSSTTRVQAATGISMPQDVVWDAAHGMLYVSVASSDTIVPNTIVPINPVTGATGTPVPAGNNPDPLAISSDSSYLWVGLDGGDAVQRFVLPGLTKDISFPVPLSSGGNPQMAVSLQAAPLSPHTLALVSGSWQGIIPYGTGIYIYDDSTQRSNFIAGTLLAGGPAIDWIQWGADDSTIYGNQYVTIDSGGVATLSVTPSGVTLVSYKGGQIDPALTEYDKVNGLLYSYGAAFEPANGSLVGSFDFPDLGINACTTDALLGRYYCVVAVAGDPISFELWVFDLNTYVLLDRVSFGWTAGLVTSPITGNPTHLVRWGNAGLAVTTSTDPYAGKAGVFLIDGAAVNPNATPDFSSGVPSRSYSWMASLVPQQAPARSGDVTVTLNGNNFTQDSTACWNCNFLQFQFLPTAYVSSQQLSVTIPAKLLSSPTTLPISVFDSGTNLFSNDSLTFTVSSASSSSTKVTPVNLAGLSMAWDANSALLFVGTADYDGAYPNSIVTVDAENGSIVTAQTVSPDPDLLNVSSTGQYLYAAFAGATTMTQFQLPGFGSPLTWTLNNPASSAVYFAGDMRAAPMSTHTTAVNLLNLESSPDETGGVVIYDDNVERPNFVPGWGVGQITPALYDTLAWGSSDLILTAACSVGCFPALSPLYDFQITQSGSAFVAGGAPLFSQGEIHSDFGTGLIYSDDGNVADPSTQLVVGTYNASGLVAPDSSLNRVFVLRQTKAQANTNNFTIQSFDEKAYAPVTSITVENLLGTPIQLVRSGTSGLAILTINGGSGSQGMLYLIHDTSLVSSAQSAGSLLSRPQELVQRRWKRVSKADIVRMVSARRVQNYR
jgi:hypothetical protein